LPDASLHSYVDSYHCGTLAADISVKSRTGHGAGTFVKVRRAVHAPITIGELTARPETWARFGSETLPATVAEIRVHKAVARRKRIEVAHLVVDGEEWWSVAVRGGGPEWPCPPAVIMAHLRDHADDAACTSYPAWLQISMDLGGGDDSLTRLRPGGALTGGMPPGSPG
jgi:hypothetical protein